MTTTTTATTEATAAPTVTAPEAATGDGRRWALQPLLDATGHTRSTLAAEVRASTATLARAARTDLSDRQADQWAIRLGVHPLSVWGWAWVDAATHTTPTTARIADALRGLIEQGALAPGEPLPTVKALTEQWGVGDKTITRAVAELTSAGLVLAPGRGQRPVVAHLRRLACQPCAHCGDPIDPGTEHYPHRPDCTQAGSGWCDCDQATHRQCCPTCGDRR